MTSSSRPVALVTMAVGYVGPALARSLARRGFDLVLQGAGDPTIGADTTLADLAPELQDLGAAVVTVDNVDLTTAHGNQVLVAAALEQFGRLDSACLSTGAIVVGPFLAMSTEQWDRVKSHNLDMAFYGLQAVLPPMVEAGAGQIVVITSATGARPEPMVSIYAGTRAGANGLVRAVGLEHAPHGVQVNAVGTNYMDFPGFLKASGADGNPERRAQIEGEVPMRRLGTMEELAAFMTVLLDGSSRFQTGQFFSFSGGWSR